MIKRDLYYERIPTKSLRDDVRYLGDILGKVIKKQEGSGFFKLVEDTRLLSKANLSNKNTKDPFKNIIKKINGLSPINIFKLSRAFSHFMNFINLSSQLMHQENLMNMKIIKKILKIKISLLKKSLKNFLKIKKFQIIKFIILQKILILVLF